MRLTFKTITIGWIAVKFGKHIHRPQTRKCNLFDPLTAFAYDRMPAKIITLPPVSADVGMVTSTNKVNMVNIIPAKHYHASIIIVSMLAV